MRIFLKLDVRISHKSCRATERELVPPGEDIQRKEKSGAFAGLCAGENAAYLFDYKGSKRRIGII